MSLTHQAHRNGLRWLETDRRAFQAASFESHDHLIIGLSFVALLLLLILVAWLPAGAQSRVQPQTQATVVDRPAPPMATSPQPASPKVIPLPVYPVAGLDLRLTPPSARRDGWGFVASVGGHSTDLSTPDDWAYNPAAGRGDLEAGLAWQHGDTSAVVGYSQFDRGSALPPGAAGARPKSTRGVLGFSARIKFP